MGLGKKLAENILYIAPKEIGGEFQKRNLGLPVQEVSQEEFLERLFGHFDGHVCIFQKRSDGQTKNVFYKHKDKERMMTFIQKTFGINTYIAYSTFFKKIKKSKEEKLRTQQNIVHTHMLVQDLDFYKFGMSDAECLQKLGAMIRNGEILCPTFLVSTGRGYQLIWILEPFKNIEGYTNDRDWKAIQEHLFDKLKAFNSDSVVKNPAAVTRLVGSKHQGSGNLVYGYLANEVVFSLSDFLMFHDIVPTADRKVKPKAKIEKPGRVTRMVGQWNEFTLNRQREEDIFTYVMVMNERGGLPIKTKRNWLALILRFHALVSTNGDEKYAEKRVLDLCEILDLTETSEEEILRRSKPAEDFYFDWVSDTWDRNKYIRGGLFYTNARMLELMDIKEDYYVQWKMKTIKIKNNKYEAARKRFEKYSEEEAEKHTWEAYQERRNEKLAEQKEDKLWQLKEAMRRHPNATQKELAKYLGFNQSTISRLKKQLDGK
ncbi:helix-turn-helix domain-containing protein [Bacillus mexicanus]|uniref:MarR family transcriptional regulator n=1 Tax=Bacillus mexicanus TaxID=2834415 RepID=UPI003D25A665